MKIVTITSFGFNKGVPSNLDMVFDVRDLPNPHKIDSLKNKSGKSSSVRNYLLQFRSFFMKILKVEDYVLSSNSDTVNVGIGCGFGKHRSVALASEVRKRLKAAGIVVYLKHRELK